MSQVCGLPSDTDDMRSALLGLAVAALLACGTAARRDRPEPSVAAGGPSDPAREPVPHLVTLPSPPRPVATPESGEPEPAGPPVAHVVALPSYEVLRETASPDGKSWCILDVRLVKAAPDETLRALWTEIRRRQATEWGRFTCRFRVSDPVAAVDVNDFMVLRAPSLPAPGALQPRAWTPDPPGDDDIVIVEEGEDYIIYEVEGFEICVAKPR